MNLLISKGSKLLLKEAGTSAEDIKHNETLFSLSNSHFGTRVSIEEAERTPEYSYNEATLANGYYDSEPT